MAVLHPPKSVVDSKLPRLAVIAMAFLQVTTPLLPSLGFGQPIGSQSDAVRTLITPAGWAFSIWGALYLGSFAFAFFQALPAHRRNGLLGQIRWPAAGAFFGNALWAAYTQVFGLSVISVAVIGFTLLCLMKIFIVFSRWETPFSPGERWLVVLPLSALAAWLTAATIVNIAAALRFHGVEAGSEAPLLASGVLLVGGAIVAGALVGGRGNPPYALVFLWALAGIYAAGGQASVPVALATALAAVLVVAGTLVGRRRDQLRYSTRS